MKLLFLIESEIIVLVKAKNDLLLGLFFFFYVFFFLRCL